MGIFSILWRAVGGKLVFLPAAVSGLYSILVKFEIVKADMMMPAIWVIVVAPLILWLIGGLLIQAYSLQKRIDAEPIPDMSIRDVLVYIGNKTDFSSKPETPEEVQKIGQEIMNAFSCNRLKLWGQIFNENQGSFFGIKPVQELDVDKWRDARLTYQLPNSNEQQLPDLKMQQEYVVSLQASSAEVKTIWNKRKWWKCGARKIFES